MNEEELNREVNDKLKKLSDQIVSQYDSEIGYSIKIGYVFIDAKIHDLFLQFGYNKYFCILNNLTKLNNLTNEKTYFVNDIYIFDFELLPADELCKDIKKLIKKIDEKHNNKIKNKEKFLKLLSK